MRLEVSEHRLPWPGLSSEMTVGHLTDVHVGPTTPWGLVEAALSAVADVDVIVLTGDYVNAWPGGARRLGRALAGIDVPKVAVLGNHDHLAGADAVTRALADGGVTVLRNASTRIGDLAIVGVDDGATGHHAPAEAFAEVSSPRDALVLTHHPPQAPIIADHGGRLILAGHTHGGQLYARGLTESVMARWLGQPYLRGWYDLGETKLYVGRGLGHPWFRWASDPEVGRFALQPCAGA